MRVVIDIPEEQYELISNKIKSIRDEIAHNNYPNKEFIPSGWVAIADGKVLPKGHGDLIDRDETTRTWGNKYFYQGVPLENYIDEVPAVIPADEEGSDENSD